MKLTKPQQKGLEYFRALADGRKPHRMGMTYPDVRVIAHLAGAGLLAVARYHYGPVYAITDAGRAVPNEDPCPQ